VTGDFFRLFTRSFPEKPAVIKAGGIDIVDIVREDIQVEVRIVIVLLELVLHLPPFCDIDERQDCKVCCNFPCGNHRNPFRTVTQPHYDLHSRGAAVRVQVGNKLYQWCRVRDKLLQFTAFSLPAGESQGNGKPLVHLHDAVIRETDEQHAVFRVVKDRMVFPLLPDQVGSQVGDDQGDGNEQRRTDDSRKQAIARRIPEQDNCSKEEHGEEVDEQDTFAPVKIRKEDRRNDVEGTQCIRPGASPQGDDGHTQQQDCKKDQYCLPVTL